MTGMSLPTDPTEIVAQYAEALREGGVPDHLIPGALGALLAVHDNNTDRAAAARLVAAMFITHVENCPRPFALYRTADPSGVSGTGVVAYGTQYADGHVNLRWSSTHPSSTDFDSIEDLEWAHGHSGKTTVIWLMEHVDEQDSPAQ